MKSVIAIAAAALFFSTASATQCYGHDGKPSNYIPCPAQTSGQSVVACCGPSDTCLSSGLCLYGNAQDSRALLHAVGCTDQTMNDGMCQPFVKQAAADARQANGNADISVMDMFPCPDGSYCSAAPAFLGLDPIVSVSADCCDKGFRLGTGYVVGKPVK